MAADGMVAGSMPVYGQAECHRFFFALRPDAATAARTAAVAQAVLGGKGLVRPERLHVTLALTEDGAAPPAALIAALQATGAAVRAGAFHLPLNRLVAHRHVVWVEPDATVPALQALQASLAEALARAGVALRAGWSFTPHETLAYRKGASVSGMVADMGWHADRLWLLHSHVGLGRHVPIGNWALEGR